MTLSVDNGFQKPSYGPGVVINEVTIAEARNISGEISSVGMRAWDIGFRLTLDIGKDFQPEFLVAGNFKRDTCGEVTGWGSAFVVREALSRLGYRGMLEPDNSIPPAALDGLEGKKFLRLSFVCGKKDNGKLRYSDWNQIATLEEGPEDLASRFRRSVNRGYPKYYRPEFLLYATPAVENVDVDEKDSF